MKKSIWTRGLSLALSVCMLLTAVVAALTYDFSGDGKTNVWDLQLAVNENKSADVQAAALVEALGGNPDEMQPNAEGVYEIYTPYGLYQMAGITNNGKEAGKTFRLMQDIDMEGGVWYTTEAFAGTLDGNGHVICNMNIVSEYKISDSAICVGLFSKLTREALVQDLKMENVNIILGEDSQANFIGFVAGSVVGEIRNCTTVGTVIDPRTTLTSTTYIGTLCGRIENVKDNPATGITVTDSSILMTAESSEIAAISGKRQKVLCKMGMEFGTLSYPEGTETDKQFKRQLGTAGWAPNYDKFKSYNWQDISGACTVTGGTGTVYNLEDPILTARRQETVDKMYEICTVEWTPSKDLTIYYYKVGTGANAGKLAYSTKTWKAGETYRGMPYNHGSGSLERFEYWMSGTDSKGRLVTKTTLPTTSFYYTYSAIREALSAYTDATFQTPLNFTDPDSGKTYDLLPAFKLSDQPLILGESVASADHAGFSRYIGNDCSQAIMWAWREVVSSDVNLGGTNISGVTQMCPTTAYQTRYGVMPVGGLVPSAYSVAACDEMYTAHGKTGFMEAYAQASRGDAIIVDQTPGGHSRMIAYDPICIRNYRGTINATNSYLITHEQGRSSSGTGWSSTCYANCVYTFDALADDTTHKNDNADGKGVNCKHYFPITIPAFHNTDSKAVTSTVTYSGGVVKSNFVVVSTVVDGNEVFTAIGQHNNVTPDSSWVGTGYREANVQQDVIAAHGDVTGKTITVNLSNGDVYTIDGTSGAVTKK